MLWVVIRPRDRINYFTNRFQVAVRLFSNRSQMTSKCGKNKKVAHEVQPSVSLFCNRSQMMSKCGKNKKVAREVQLSVSLMFLPHFDVLCDLLLNRRTATWNLFVLYYKELKYTEKSLFISNFPTLTETKIAFDVIYCL